MGHIVLWGAEVKTCVINSTMVIGRLNRSDLIGPSTLIDSVTDITGIYTPSLFVYSSSPFFLLQ